MARTFSGRASTSRKISAYVIIVAKELGTLEYPDSGIRHQQGPLRMLPDRVPGHRPTLEGELPVFQAASRRALDNGPL